MHMCVCMLVYELNCVGMCMCVHMYICAYVPWGPSAQEFGGSGYDSMNSYRCLETYHLNIWTLGIHITVCIYISIYMHVLPQDWLASLRG